MKTQIIVNYSHIRYSSEMHTMLCDAIDWPHLYDCNPDALYDIFWCEGAPEQLIFCSTSQFCRHNDWVEAWEQMPTVLGTIETEWQNHGWKFQHTLID